MRIILHSLLLTTIATGAFASTLPVTFGPPLYVSNSLVFAESTVDSSRRVICIEHNGRKIWDIERPERYVRVWFSVSNLILATTATELLLINIDNGSITKSHKGYFQHCFVRKFTDTSVLILHDKEGVDLLTCLELNTGRIVWQVSNIARILDVRVDIVICEYAERVAAGGTAYYHTNLKLFAIRGVDGARLWDYKLQENSLEREYLSGGGIGNYFIATNAGKILCFERITGKLVSFLLIDSQLEHGMSLFVKGDAALLWLPKAVSVSSAKYQAAPRITTSDIYLSVFALSVNFQTVSRIKVPDLSISGLAQIHDCQAMSIDYFTEEVMIYRSLGRIKAYTCRTRELLWDGGPWTCGSARDGWMYFSKADNLLGGGRKTSINRINILTGATEKIYEEDKRDIARGADISTNDVDISVILTPDI